MIRIHAIEVTDVAGTAHQRVELGDITVLRGDNEVGKTTLLTAVDVLLHFTDNSTAEPVRAIIPKHRDAAPQIRVEMNVGEYRFSYFKRFASRSVAGRTEVTFSEPEQMTGRVITGRDAHDKVTQLLGEHADVGLWKALWIQQTGSIELPQLQGRTAVLQAVDVAAGLGTGGDDDGGTVDGDSEERRNTTIMDAATRHYLKYFTKSRGDLINEHKAAGKAAEQAKREVTAAEEVARQVEAWVSEHASAGRKLDQSKAALVDLLPRQEKLTEQAAQHEKASEAIAGLEREAQTAHKQAASVQQLLEARHRLAADAQAAADTETVAAETAQAAVAAAVAAEQAATDSEVPLAGLAAAVGRSAVRLKQARTGLELLRDTEESASLKSALDHIDNHSPQLRQLEADLAGMPAIDGAALAAIEAAAATMATAQAVLEADSPRLTVEALTDIAVAGLAESSERVSAGDVREWPLTAQVTVTAADAVRITVTPGTSEKARRCAATEAVETLRALCEAAGVVDAVEARTVMGRRTDIAAQVDALRAGIKAVLGGRSETDLRDQLAQLQGRITQGVGAGTLPASRTEAEQELANAELEDAQNIGRHSAAVEAAESLRVAARDRSADLGIANANLASAKASASARATALQEARDKEADADLFNRARASAAAAEEAHDGWQQVLAAFDTAAVAQITDELTAVRAAVATASGALRKMEDIQLTLSTRLQQVGDVHEALARATDNRDRIVADYEAMRARADAAKILYETLSAARVKARTIYAAPYKERLESLACTAFGRPVKLDLDENLTVTHRTMDGATVKFSQLSGGAKEQLAVCARLAFASLISKSSGLVPVIIDDALGYTDDERMENIDRVFNAAKTGCQVIILTCTRKRYAGVTGADTFELTR